MVVRLGPSYNFFQRRVVNKWSFLFSNLIFLWQYEPLLGIFANCGLRCLEHGENSSHVRQSDIWMSFVLSKSA